MSRGRLLPSLSKSCSGLFAQHPPALGGRGTLPGAWGGLGLLGCFPPPQLVVRHHPKALIPPSGLEMGRRTRLLLALLLWSRCSWCFIAAIKPG